jgi:hypothetical protein
MLAELTRKAAMLVPPAGVAPASPVAVAVTKAMSETSVADRSALALSA